MPNWCSNRVTLRGSAAAIADIEQTLSTPDKGLFESIIPFPSGEWDYSWCVENWGTKWDASILSFEREEEEIITIEFDTAWSPPSKIYEKLDEMGIEVEAYYYEPGVSFVGKYTSEDGDECYEFDLTESSIADLPEELREMWGIEPWEDEEAEDDLA